MSIFAALLAQRAWVEHGCCGCHSTRLDPAHWTERPGSKGVATVEQNRMGSAWRGQEEEENMAARGKMIECSESRKATRRRRVDAVSRSLEGACIQPVDASANQRAGGRGQHEWRVDSLRMVSKVAWVSRGRRRNGQAPGCIG